MAKQTVVNVTIDQLCGLMLHNNNKYIWIEWESNQTVNKTILKEGAPAGSRLKSDRETNPWSDRCITKRYRAVMRNNFNFRNRVKKVAGEAAADWEPEERSWGGHVDGTPFVVHENQTDGVNRLHAHLLPSRYHFDATTGFYVDGTIATAADVARYTKPKAERPTGIVDAARFDNHPVNARIEDIRFVRMGGTTYKLLPATVEQIERVAALAVAYSESLAAAA